MPTGQLQVRDVEVADLVAPARRHKLQGRFGQRAVRIKEEKRHRPRAMSCATRCSISVDLPVPVAPIDGDVSRRSSRESQTSWPLRGAYVRVWFHGPGRSPRPPAHVVGNAIGECYAATAPDDRAR